jgi:hypothetical protein
MWLNHDIRVAAPGGMTAPRHGRAQPIFSFAKCRFPTLTRYSPAESAA